ncbi:hypothetical protein B0J13DRAFT_524074 [Dactylonectria estremocensis]|uniref:Uncharacterized protein n=1 Tax=Dactylonectria estremocensis TaxID=1079267 RepID=A0A9P9F1P6_9HYPO|nr:hypothetical protein B0J13DRAFT_524074 [Dactylonectria estremocensis]
MYPHETPGLGNDPPWLHARVTASECYCTLPCDCDVARAWNMRNSISSHCPALSLNFPGIAQALDLFDEFTVATACITDHDYSAISAVLKTTNQSLQRIYATQADDGITPVYLAKRPGVRDARGVVVDRVLTLALSGAGDHKENGHNGCSGPSTRAWAREDGPGLKAMAMIQRPATGERWVANLLAFFPPPHLLPDRLPPSSPVSRQALKAPTC